MRWLSLHVCSIDILLTKNIQSVDASLFSLLLFSVQPFRTWCSYVIIFNDLCAAACLFFPELGPPACLFFSRLVLLRVYFSWTWSSCVFIFPELGAAACLFFPSLVLLRVYFSRAWCCCEFSLIRLETKEIQPTLAISFLCFVLVSCKSFCLCRRTSSTRSCSSAALSFARFPNLVLSEKDDQNISLKTVRKLFWGLFR